MINLTSQFKEKFQELLDNSTSILITSHIGPDDDSIASTLATFYFLKKQYPKKNIEIIYSGQQLSRWSYFKNFSEIKFCPDVFKESSRFDLVIFLDGSQFSRFSKVNPIPQLTFKTICIDHHGTEADKFDLSWIESGATSTSELLYYLFSGNILEKEIAEIFLLGILGDTGSLTFVDKSKASIFGVVERLVREGDINIQELKSHYFGYSKNILEPIKEFVKNLQIMEVTNWPKFILTYLSRDFLSGKNYSYLEVSEASHIVTSSYLTSIKGVSWGLIFTPSDETNISVSGRSLPDSVSIRKIMEEMGIGGGHDRAGGGEFKSDKKLTTEECKDKLLSWLKENPPLY